VLFTVVTAANQPVVRAAQRVREVAGRSTRRSSTREARIASAPIPRRAAWQRLGVTADGCIVTHFCIDCAFNTNSHFHIVNHMKRFTR
jgi:hypothetical protein